MNHVSIQGSMELMSQHPVLPMEDWPSKGGEDSLGWSDWKDMLTPGRAFQ